MPWQEEAAAEVAALVERLGVVAETRTRCSDDIKQSFIVKPRAEGCARTSMRCRRALPGVLGVSSSELPTLT